MTRKIVKKNTGACIQAFVQQINKSPKIRAFTNPYVTVRTDPLKADTQAREKVVIIILSNVTTHSIGRKQ